MRGPATEAQPSRAAHAYDIAIREEVYTRSASIHKYMESEAKL